MTAPATTPSRITHLLLGIIPGEVIVLTYIADGSASFAREGGATIELPHRGRIDYPADVTAIKRHFRTPAIAAVHTTSPAAAQAEAKAQRKEAAA